MKKRITQDDLIHISAVQTIGIYLLDYFGVLGFASVCSVIFGVVLLFMIRRWRHIE